MFIISAHCPLLRNGHTVQSYVEVTGGKTPCDLKYGEMTFGGYDCHRCPHLLTSGWHQVGAKEVCAIILSESSVSTRCQGHCSVVISEKICDKIGSLECLVETELHWPWTSNSSGLSVPVSWLFCSTPTCAKPLAQVIMQGTSSLSKGFYRCDKHHDPKHDLPRCPSIPMDWLLPHQRLIKKIQICLAAI